MFCDLVDGYRHVAVAFHVGVDVQGRGGDLGLLGEQNPFPVPGVEGDEAVLAQRAQPDMSQGVGRLRLGVVPERLAMPPGPSAVIEPEFPVHLDGRRTRGADVGGIPGPLFTEGDEGSAPAGPIPVHAVVPADELGVEGLHLGVAVKDVEEPDIHVAVVEHGQAVEIHLGVVILVGPEHEERIGPGDHIRTFGVGPAPRIVAVERVGNLPAKLEGDHELALAVVVHHRAPVSDEVVDVEIGGMTRVGEVNAVGGIEKVVAGPGFRLFHAVEVIPGRFLHELPDGIDPGGELVALVGIGFVVVLDHGGAVQAGGVAGERLAAKDDVVGGSAEGGLLGVVVPDDHSPCRLDRTGFGEFVDDRAKLRLLPVEAVPGNGVEDVVHAEVPHLEELLVLVVDDRAVEQDTRVFPGHVRVEDCPLFLYRVQGAREPVHAANVPIVDEEMLIVRRVGGRAGGAD